LVLDDLALHPVRKVHARGNPVVDRPEIPNSTGLIEDVVLHEGVAEAHDRGPFVLAPDLRRVQRLADVRDRDMAGDDDVTGLAVDLDLHRGAVELVQRRRPTEWMIWLGLFPHLAEADHLPAEPAEPPREHVGDRPRPLPDPDLAP